MRTRGWTGALTALIVLVVGTAPAVAADLGAFYGSWKGEALAETRGVDGDVLTARDIDVTITPAGDAGFSVTWSTVLRRDAPDRPRKTSSLTFRPSDRPGVWRTRGPADPFRPGGLAWARLTGDTLTVFTLTIAEDGGAEMHVYDRRVEGERMMLGFTRQEDGRVVRQVTGTLLRE